MKFRSYLFLFSFVALTSTNLFAEEVYYLNKLTGCEIKLYRNKKLMNVDERKFTNVIISVTKIPKKPSFVAFKHENDIYITRETCVMDATKKEIDNGLLGTEYKSKPKELSEKEKFNSYKYFVEVETALVTVADKNSVAKDYNEIFPSTSSTNPTVWGAAGSSEYKTTRLLSVGFGFRSNANRFLAFKIRLLSGKKSDNVELTDVNTSISQSGVWTYEDSFRNFYGGYKFIFLDYSAWKPVIAGYLGVSQMSSRMSDGIDSYTLSSLGIAGLVEAGMEYHLNSHFGLGANLGFEYLGKRSMKFKSDSGHENLKTNMSYNNTFLSFGIKYYF